MRKGGDILLNEKEEVFVSEYLKSRNILQSYMRAFGVDKDTARKESRKFFRQKHIQDSIFEYKAQLEGDYNIDVKEYIEFLLKGAFADVGDYVKFGQEEVPQYNSDGTVMIDLDSGEPITRKVNRVYLANSGDVDTSLITDISNGKDGVKIKLVDKMMCWNRLQEFFGWADDNNIKENLNTQILKALAGRVADNWNSDEDVYEELHEALGKEN